MNTYIYIYICIYIYIYMYIYKYTYIYIYTTVAGRDHGTLGIARRSKRLVACSAIPGYTFCKGGCSGNQVCSRLRFCVEFPASDLHWLCNPGPVSLRPPSTAPPIHCTPLC